MPSTIHARAPGPATGEMSLPPELPAESLRAGMIQGLRRRGPGIKARNDPQARAIVNATELIFTDPPFFDIVEHADFPGTMQANIMRCQFSLSYE